VHFVSGTAHVEKWKSVSPWLEERERRGAQLTGEVRKLTDILGDEGHALHTRPYQSLHAQLLNAQEDALRFRSNMQHLQREGESLRGELRATTMAATKTVAESRRAQLAEARVADCEARLTAVMGERDQATYRLSTQAETAARQRLNEERAVMLEKVTAEVEQLRAEAKKARGLREELDTAKLSSARAEAEKTEARAEAADTKAALERTRGGAAPAEGSTEALREALAAAERKAGAATAAAAAAEEQLREKNEESEAFMSEVEAIGAAYEESQTQNARLMERLTERDGTESKAVTDKVQAQQQVRRLKEEKQGLEAAVTHERGAAAAASHRAAAVEEAAAAAAQDLARAREESSQLFVRMDDQTRTLRQLEASSRDHREALEASQRQAAALSSRSQEDAAAVSAAERRVRQCEEQIAGLKKRNEKLHQVGGSSDEYKEEVRSPRMIPNHVIHLAFQVLNFCLRLECLCCKPHLPCVLSYVPSHDVAGAFVRGP